MTQARKPRWGAMPRTPLLDDESPFNTMMSSFDEAALTIGLSEDEYRVLRKAETVLHPAAVKLRPRSPRRVRRVRRRRGRSARREGPGGCERSTGRRCRESGGCRLWAHLQARHFGFEPGA